jgi:hypothetical protein
MSITYEMPLFIIRKMLETGFPEEEGAEQDSRP